ncbi:phosphotransferase family protein [Cryptosporangium aurantiacum]|uniref:Predicted kinase, aminoglycoside phosphotransferase (APT) family n=1 Tax=Cryptosporangium aurantiacum TaxID=134849 RepID=A0A1M7RB76_9ACTN|nr:phosphotransferase family protein [Cryptosporangium aurantiacum]SHN43547.1 Predicted kinase, aminoglycoside phosphotransferase (APT) family [Cryptosporangium aurantiacum]
MPADPAYPAPADPGVEPAREALRVRLSQLWGTRVTVVASARLTGGASRETLRVRVAADGRSRDLVLRRDVLPQAPPDALAREAAALRAAAAAGVPVPAVVDAGPALGGHPYLVMEYVDGEVLPRRLLRDAAYATVRTTLAGALGEIAARIHTADPAGVAGLTRPDPLGLLRELADDDDTPRPAVELGLAWLAARTPPAAPDTLVHGDLRNGNVLVGPEGVRAVLDWELVHAGDPVEDLGWLCVKAWRFGSPEPVGGFGSRAQLLDGYEQVAGWRPAEEQLRWWEVYGTLRWVLLCRRQALAFLRGDRESLEHAVIGRRVCEAEFDLLLALGLTEPSPPPADPAPGPRGAGRSPHDAPDAGHLIATVAGAFTDGTFGDAYLTRVAANALRIAGRELALGPVLADRHRARLDALGLTDDAALAAAIRGGDTTGPVTTAVVDAVRDKLAVANPRYLGQPG